MNSLNRRDLLKALSVASFTTPLVLAAPEPGAPLFFTKDEFALLDTLTELIIPKDEHSGGAHDAGVAAYIDRTVAEAFVPEDKTSWKNGLKSVDELSSKMHGKAFLKVTPSQQVAVLQRMSSHSESAEASDADSHGRKKTLSDAFFGQLKDTTISAYYNSYIGIHDDINYKGNVILMEFVGYMPNEKLPPLSSLG